MKLLVDSEARDPRLNSTNETSTDLKYNYTLHEETGHVRCLKLEHAQVPRTFYAVVADWSQRFEWTDNATARAVNLPLGTYDGQTLATALTTQIATVTTGFTVTYDDATNKLTFVNATGNTQTIATQSTGLTTTFPQPGINTVLGHDGTVVAILNGASYTMPNMVDMSQPRFLFVSVTSGSANSSKNIRDWFNRRQFMIPFGDTPYLSYKEFAVNSDFQQCDLVDGQSFKRLLVEWRHGIANIDVVNSAAATSTRRYPLSFNGVPHNLLFTAE